MTSHPTSVADRNKIDTKIRQYTGSGCVRRWIVTIYAHFVVPNLEYFARIWLVRWYYIAVWEWKATLVNLVLLCCCRLERCHRSACIERLQNCRNSALEAAHPCSQLRSESSIKLASCLSTTTNTRRKAISAPEFMHTAFMMSMDVSSRSIREA